MSRLMIGGDALLLLGDHTASFLRADRDAQKGTAQIRRRDKRPALGRHENDRLVQEILKIRPGKTGSHACELRKIHFLRELLVGCVQP